MPITLKTAAHGSKKWTGSKRCDSANELLHRTFKENKDGLKIHRNELSQEFSEKAIISSSDNGFVRAIWAAYSGHHHLTLRPEDVWFSILSQLNFYINAHAEELRSFFVAHEGQKELEVVTDGSITSVDFGLLAVRMTELIEKNVVDPDLREWILPSFSTTTRCDKIIASILMMGTLQKYFSYKMTLLCGIPTVTLLGDRSDWEALLTKVEKISQLGKEPTQFANLLRPVLRHFVLSFDDPKSPAVLDFWGKCVHHISGGSGPDYLCGWATAFCFWDEEGASLFGSGPPPWAGEVDPSSENDPRAPGCILDGVAYHKVDTGDIPRAYVSVPVTVDDNGNVHHTTMMAGLVGIYAASSGQGGDEIDSLQPLSGWWLYENGPSERD